MLPGCSFSGDSYENPRKIAGVFRQLFRDNLTLSMDSMDNPERFHGHAGMVPGTPEYSDDFQRFRILTLNSLLFSMVFPWFPCIFHVFLYVLLRDPGKATAGHEPHLLSMGKVHLACLESVNESYVVGSWQTLDYDKCLLTRQRVKPTYQWNTRY